MENTYSKAYHLLFNAISDCTNTIFEGEVSRETEAALLKLKKAQQQAEELLIQGE